MNPSTGRFISMDAYGGSTYDPMSLHKYLYGNGNPVMNSDPTGYFTFTILGLQMELQIETILRGMAVGAVAGAFYGGIVASLDTATEMWDSGERDLRVI